MNATSIFVIVCCLLLSKSNASATQDHKLENSVIEKLLKIVVKFVMLNFQRKDNILLYENATLKIPSNSIITGDLAVGNAHVFGLHSLKYTLSTASTDKDISLTYSATLSKAGLETLYVMDIGVINEIPLFGKGKISISVSDISLKVDMVLNATDLKKPYLDKLVINPAFRNAPIEITGFWNNDGLSKILSTALSSIELLTGMWWNYENEFLSCGISNLLRIVINNMLHHDEEITFDCDNIARIPAP